MVSGTMRQDVSGRHAENDISAFSGARTIAGPPEQVIPCIS
ncbi:hypothetical protein Z946_2840 [Sulfitobacter noctilucicola]|nr:hypothetical protein Z946_2840 [Sulfitobacter noctilucicola]